MFDLDPVLLLIVIATILMSMTFHEAMHAFTGYWLGDDTARLEGRLTLNPLRHIDPFLTILMPLLLLLAGGPVLGGAKPVPFNPNNVRGGEYGAALVGFAGPLTNLLLAVAAAGIFRILGPEAGTLLNGIFRVFVSVNIGFFVFNMIPFPPLDGSRVLYAIAPEPIQRVMQQIESYGLIAFFLFFFVGFRFISPIVGSIIQSILSVLLG